MNLLGEAVKHKRFGNGVITKLCENRVTVCFSESQKLFLFPDAFPKYLTMKNNSIQKEIEKINEKKKREIQERKQKIETENIYRRRLCTMKNSPKSQVVYNISENEISNLEYLEAGNILSGNTKGKPRIPLNVRPISAIIMTDWVNAEEKERCIIGIAMAHEYFWGSECKDGKIRLHQKYKLVLSDENRISFWKYFKREAFTKQWGGIPFKYFQNETMERILFDVCNETIGTEQEDEAMELYSYFCSMNRITERPIVYKESGE